MLAWVMNSAITPSPAQHVYCRVKYDGVDPIDLDNREQRRIARALFGKVDRIPAEARHVQATIKGARVAGSLLGPGLFNLYSGLTADLSGLMKVSKRIAGQVAYCLRKMDAIEQVGKRGRAYLYARKGQN